MERNQYKLNENIGINKIPWKEQYKIKSNTGECNTS